MVENQIDLLADAIAIAAVAHAGQSDKIGEPYILHPLRLMIHMSTEEERIVAVLHDVVEDTQWTVRALARQGFSAAAMEALSLLTRKDGETYMNYIDRIATNPIATRVKIADLTDNLDPRRVSKLPANDLGRLRNKYEHALDRLREVRA